MADNEERGEERAREEKEAKEAEQRSTKQSTSRQSKPKQRAVRERRRERGREDEQSKRRRNLHAGQRNIITQAPYWYPEECTFMKEPRGSTYVHTHRSTTTCS